MTSAISKILSAFLLTVLVVSGPVFALSARRANDPMSVMLRNLVDQSGRPADDGRFVGRYVLVNFIFTTCGTTCPTQAAELARFDKSLPASLRAKVMYLSISVDPGNDKPDRLRAFAKAYGSDPRRWAYVTGRPDRIMRLVRNFAAMRPLDKDASLHTTEVRLFDPHHRMIQRYSGVPLASRQIRDDLEALIGSRK